MSELKAYDHEFRPNEYGKFYLKSEADKVIAELEDKLKEQTSIAEEGWKEFRTYHTSYAEAVKELYEKNKELRHSKYKRCLAMAKWCRMHDEFTQLESERIGLLQRTLFFEYRKKAMWWNKWSNRWLELAEKFKEAK